MQLHIAADADILEGEFCQVNQTRLSIRARHWVSSPYRNGEGDAPIVKICRVSIYQALVFSPRFLHLLPLLPLFSAEHHLGVLAETLGFLPCLLLSHYFAVVSRHAGKAAHLFDLA